MSGADLQNVLNESAILSARRKKQIIESADIYDSLDRIQIGLEKKGVEFSEFDVWEDPSLKPEMIQRAKGSHTVPQIFVDETHVGGCDDLYELERAGKLDALLEG